MQKTLTYHYQNLHQIPELDNQLPKTQEYILSHLPNCEITIIENGGILAYYHKNQETTIALRCEMDALPILEQTNLPYQSTHTNCMHACAHDAHMAILLTLVQNIPFIQTTSNILFIFEYAEETYGGAKYIIQHPKYQEYNIHSIYGLHIWPKLPKKIITSQHLMATSCEVIITIHGTSSHIADIDNHMDANEIASQFLQQASLQQKHFIIRFGIIKGGNAPNIISNQTIIHGSIRALTIEHLEFAKKYLWQLSTLYMMRHSNIIEINFTEGYPPLINTLELIPTNIDILPLSYFTTESFGYYLQNKKGLYVLLGTAQDIPLHSPQFIVPLDILSIGYQYFLQRIMAEVAR